MKFICPKCSAKLNISDGGSAVCPMRHSYDKSRFGYYNLLLSNTAGTHGDNREMIEARRAFLDTGAYLPLANTVAELVDESISDGGVLLDIGLGEGYYTSHVANRLLRSGKECEVLGFDISKDAVRYAARRCPEASLAVASAYKMPIADGSVDVAVNIFSPLAKEETVRVLRKGGSFIMAIPDENHLYGLKCALYKTPYKNEVQDSKIDGLKLIKSEHVAYTLTLDAPKKIHDLFMMTPYAYRTPKEARERLLSLNSLTTEVEFIVFVYKKA